MPPLTPLKARATLAELRDIVLSLGNDVAVPTRDHVRALQAQVDGLRREVEALRTAVQTVLDAPH